MSSPHPASLINGIVVHEIYAAKGEKFNPDKSIRLVSQIIHDRNKNFAFRINASPGNKVAFQVLEFDTKDNRQGIDISVKGIYPHVEIDTIPYAIPPLSKDTNFHCIFPLIQFGALEGSWFWPGLTPDITKGSDLEVIVHSAGQAANQGATVNINIFAVQKFPFNPKDRQETERKFLGLPSDGERLARLFGNIAAITVSAGINVITESKSKGSSEPFFEEPTILPPNEWQKKSLAKLRSQDVYETIILIEICAPTVDILSSAANVLIRHYHNEEAIKKDYATFNFTEDVAKTHPIMAIRSQADLDRFSMPSFINFLNNNLTTKKKYTSYLTTAEIANLFHLPHDGMSESLVNFVSGNKPHKNILDNQDGVIIGQAARQLIRLPDVDRQSHINIVGKNGTGKSSLMLNMIRQDIQRGKGVGVIDPDGRLIDDILKSAIPDGRMGDVVVLDIGDVDYPVPLNPLNIRDDNGRIASGLVADIFNRIYPDFARAERARAFLMGALGALNLVENPIIADAVRLLEDLEYRADTFRGKEKQLDKGTYRFWASFAKLSSANQRDYPNPVIHRLNTLIAVDALQPILCHPKTLNWPQMMRDNRIVLISLNPHTDSVGKQEQQLLGTVTLSMILSAARNHGDPNPFDFYLYVDEVERFINTSLDEFFSGIRKFGVHLTVANQFLGQLQGDTLDSLIGNIGGSFIFEIGDTDAKRLEKSTQPGFNDVDLMSLGKFHPVVKMKLNNASYPAFDIYTEKIAPPDEKTANFKAEAIRRMSRQKWTPTTRQSIMDDLDKRYPQDPIIWDDDRGRRNSKGKQKPADVEPDEWGDKKD